MNQAITFDDVVGGNIKKASRDLRRSAKIFIAISGGMLSILWLNAPEQIELFHKAQGLLLGMLTLLPSYLWLKSKVKTIPFIELISLHYFFIFCPPVFLGPVKFVGALQYSLIGGDDLTRLLFIILAGVSFFLIGYYAVHPPKMKSLPKFFIDHKRAASFFLVYLGIAAISPMLVPRLPGAIAKIGDIVFKVNGSVVVYGLTLFMYSGRLSAFQRKIFILELLLFLGVCLASGWLGMFAFPLVGFFLASIQAKRQVPWTKILLGGILLITLQASKGIYREAYWEGRMGGTQLKGISGAFDRTAFWLENAFASLSSLSEGTRGAAMERANHLSFMGHVIKKTPEPIPYLNGYSYTIIPLMMAPRVLFPGKPSTMHLTNMLSLRYGWLSEHFVGRVALSPGLMDEAYMNFGTFGVISVMLLFGISIRWLVINFDNSENGLGWRLALIGFMLGGGLMVTWTAASYFGGLWQTMIAIAVLYLPLRVRPRKMQRG